MVALILLGGCTPEHDPEQDKMQRPHHGMSGAVAHDIKVFEQQRLQVLSELEQLRKDINLQLKRYEERSVITNMDDTEQELNRQIIRDLQQQRTLMDRQIEKVQRAAIDNWSDLQSDSKGAMEHARSFDEELRAAEPVLILEHGNPSK